MCVNDVSAYVHVGVCVSAGVPMSSVSVSLRVCHHGCVCVSVSQHQGMSVSRGPQVSEDACGYSPVCAGVCACLGPCPRGWLSVAKRPWVGECVPQRVPASACVCPCLRGRLSVEGRPRVSVGVCAPASALGFTL